MWKFYKTSSDSDSKKLSRDGIWLNIKKQVGGVSLVKYSLPFFQELWDISGYTSNRPVMTENGQSNRIKGVADPKEWIVEFCNSADTDPWFEEYYRTSTASGYTWGESEYDPGVWAWWDDEGIPKGDCVARKSRIVKYKSVKEIAPGEWTVYWEKLTDGDAYLSYILERTTESRITLTDERFAELAEGWLEFNGVTGLKLADIRMLSLSDDRTALDAVTEGPRRSPDEERSLESWERIQRVVSSCIRNGGQYTGYDRNFDTLRFRFSGKGEPAGSCTVSSWGSIAELWGRKAPESWVTKKDITEQQ